MDAVFCHNTRSNISLTRYDRHHKPASGTGVIAPGIRPGQEKGMKSAIVILSSLLLLTACGGGGGGGGGSDSDSSNDAQPRYTVSATAGAGGSVTPASQTIRHGSTGTLILTPDTGYAIASVSGCNGTLNGNTFITGPVTEPCNITATFSTRTDDVQYTINANASVGGSVSPSGQQVQQGATGVITVTPDTGYTIASVSGCN